MGDVRNYSFKPKVHLGWHLVFGKVHWAACGTAKGVPLTTDYMEVTCEACRRTLAFRHSKDRPSVKNPVSSIPIFMELK